MAQNLLQLPPEMRECIYIYCTSADLKNLACCSRSYYNSIQNYIWRSITIYWNVLLKENISLRILENLKFVTSLKMINKATNKDAGVDFVNDNMNDSDSYSDNVDDDDNDIDDNDIDDDNDIGNGNGNSNGNRNNDISDKYFGQPIQWSDICCNYEQIIENIDSSKLLKLSIHGVINDDGFKKTIDKLYNVHKLILTATYYISDIAWKYLQSLTHLRKIKVENCRIHDHNIKDISLISSLQELHLLACFLLSDKCFDYISGMTKLKHLSVTHNLNISMNSSSYFKKFKGLSHLNVECTSVHNHTLLYISQYLETLEILNLSGCSDVTDYGLKEICKSSSIAQLSIDLCNQITDVGFSYLGISMKALKHLTFSWNSNLTASVFSHLSDRTSLKTLDIMCMNHMLSSELIEQFCHKTGMKSNCVHYSSSLSYIKLRKGGCLVAVMKNGRIK